MIHFSLSIDQLDRAFIAGFLEGEACFSIVDELAALIGDGFHGRRAAELETWREAVSTWIDGHGDERRIRLAALKERLHALSASAPRRRPPVRFRIRRRSWVT